MADFFSETLKKFDIAFDLKGSGIFKEGHTFEPMTYKNLCEHVAYESCCLGGPPLRPQRRLDDSGMIDYVNFYCPHGRKHVDQAGRKDAKTPLIPLGWTVVGLTGERARNILKKGAATDWILEVFPDTSSSKYKKGDRWFTKVVDGRIVGLSHRLEIRGVRWCITNSVQPDPVYPDPIRLEVSMVIAYGPPTAPMFEKFK